METQIQPQAIDAERAYLASLMLDPQGRPILGTGIAADSFYLTAHAEVFEAIAGLVAAGNPVDLLTVRQALTDAGKLDGLGGALGSGADALLSIAGAEFSSANADYYATIVREKAALRAYVRIGSETARAAMDPAAQAAEVGAALEQAVIAVRVANTNREPIPLPKLAGEAMNRLMAPPEKRAAGLKTGFFLLDNCTGGMRPGELTILAARPSMGKSSLAVWIADYVARNGRAVLLFSLEMSAAQIATNLTCGAARIDTWASQNRRLSAEEAERLVGVAGEISETQLWIDESPELSVGEMRARARRFALSHPLGLIVVDYLQLLKGDTRRRDATRQEEVSEIGRALKTLAGECKCPVLALAQLNRAVESRPGHKPIMADLRESGSLEQDADCVLLLHRPGYYADSQEPETKALVNVAKNRNGKTAEVELAFIAPYMRFENAQIRGQETA